MKFKDGVDWTNIHPQIVQKMDGVDAIYRGFGVEAVITSGRDGKHGIGSLHYEGKAFDLRTWNVIEEVARQLRMYLGPDFDVVVESDHIHVEFDPNHDRKVG